MEEGYHDERMQNEGIPYFINGTGGSNNVYQCLNNRISKSKECYNPLSGGAQLITVTNRRVRFDFFEVENPETPLDSVTVKKFVRF